jgi:hypothetical protein
MMEQVIISRRGKRVAPLVQSTEGEIMVKHYPSAFANSTLIILFSKMLKFSNKNKNSFNSKIMGKENSEYLGVFPFVEI